MEERQAAEKTCKRCGQLKPAAEFYKNKLMADGLYSHCKVWGLRLPALLAWPALPHMLWQAPWRPPEAGTSGQACWE